MKKVNLRKTQDISEKVDIIRELSWISGSIASDLRQLGGQIQNKENDEMTNPLVLKKRLKWLKKFQSTLGKAQNEHWDLFFKQR
jgi:hypothetical protein